MLDWFECENLPTCKCTVENFIKKIIIFGRRQFIDTPDSAV